jgi:hypothetical protein
MSKDQIMHTREQAKSMAKSMRSALADRQVSLSHGACLEIVARQLGFVDWNTLAAALPTGEANAAPAQVSCSFCGKHRHEVRALVEGGCSRLRGSAAGHCVFICDECIAFCVLIKADTIDASREESTN